MSEPGAFLEEFSDDEKGSLSGLRFGVLTGRFYEDLANRLMEGADGGFELAGVPISNVTHFSVPGAYELPFAAKQLAQTGTYAGVACLGVVIRGETDHYDFVCAEAARGIQDVQLEIGVPCAFGVITCDTMEQALARAGGEGRDTGRGAAQTVLHMAVLAAAI